MTDYTDRESYFPDCPQNIKDSIRAYIRGRPTGGFLEAVLQNDLLHAVSLADSQNKASLQLRSDVEDFLAILAYIYNEVPGNIWGSPEAVHQHLLACAEARKDHQGYLAGVVHIGYEA